MSRILMSLTNGMFHLYLCMMKMTYLFTQKTVNCYKRLPGSSTFARKTEMKNEMQSQYILYGNPQRGEPFRKNTVQKGALSYIY